jgi:hypothetical protein
MTPPVHGFKVSSLFRKDISYATQTSHMCRFCFTRPRRTRTGGRMSARQKRNVLHARRHKLLGFRAQRFRRNLRRNRTEHGSEPARNPRSRSNRRCGIQRSIRTRNGHAQSAEHWRWVRQLWRRWGRIGNRYNRAEHRNRYRDFRQQLRHLRNLPKRRQRWKQRRLERRRWAIAAPRCAISDR